MKKTKTIMDTQIHKHTHTHSMIMQTKNIWHKMKL